MRIYETHTFELDRIDLNCMPDQTSTLTSRTDRDMVFRIYEIREWVCEFIDRGDAEKAGLWAEQLARIGNLLLGKIRAAMDAE